MTTTKTILDRIYKAIEDSGYQCRCYLTPRYLYEVTVGTKYTVGTWLHYGLVGKAADYSQHYERRILSDCKALAELGVVQRVRSVGGATAWVAADATEDNEPTA